MKSLEVLVRNGQVQLLNSYFPKKKEKKKREKNKIQIYKTKNKGRTKKKEIFTCIKRTIKDLW